MKHHTLLRSLLISAVVASTACPALAVTETDANNIGDSNNDPNNSVFYFTSGQTLTPAGALQANLLTGSTVTGHAPDVGSLAGINDLSPGTGGPGTGNPNDQELYGNYNNMAYFGNTLFGSSISGNATVTFTIALGGGSPSATGYNLSSISVFDGWTDHASFNDQHYSISLSTDGVNYTPFYSVNYMPFLAANDDGNNQCASTLVTLSNLGASGIKGIQFAVSAGTDANGQQQEGQLFQEIEVFGTSTSVPEPTAFALLMAGLCVLPAWRASRNFRKVRS